MTRFFALALLSIVTLPACIEDPPTRTDPQGDAKIADARIRQDAESSIDAEPRFDAEPLSDAEPRIDAALAPRCADNGDAAGCDAAGCAWRQSCVDPTPCARVELRTCIQVQCIITADERCVDPTDPDRCDGTGTPAQCELRQCIWRRGQGEAQASCWPDPAPSVQDCAQPDPGTCEAAGCEWTGQGCAPPNQTPCAQLDDAACNARVECTLGAAGCAIDPNAPCARMSTDDCSTRPDCGMRGLLCVALPQDPCPRSPQWVCEQRQDCAALYPDCDDAPKGGQGGDDGAGGRGPVTCESRDDCHASQGCVRGLCVTCSTFLGCTER